MISPRTDEIRPFAERARQALTDDRLPRNLLAFQRAWRLTRDAAFDRLARETPSLGASTASFDAARQKLVEAKNQVLRDPPAARQRFIEATRSVGSVVHEVQTADEARETILRILRERGVKLLAKGKSMVAEEIFLNHHLGRNTRSARCAPCQLGKPFGRARCAEEAAGRLTQECPRGLLRSGTHHHRADQLGLLGEDAPQRRARLGLDCRHRQKS